jgi:dipeptidyl-peptidase-4
MPVFVARRFAVIPRRCWGGLSLVVLLMAALAPMAWAQTAPETGLPAASGAVALPTEGPTLPPKLAPSLSLDRIFSDPPLAGRLPRAAAVSPAGQWVSFLRPSAQDSEVMELWGQPVAGGEPRKLVAVADLIGKREVVLTEAEKMALERRRVRGSGILAYHWCGQDDRRLLIPLSGDLYLVELGADDSPEAPPVTRRLSKDEAEPEREPRCDAAGRQVAYVKRGDLWVQDLQSGKARRLTHTGSATHSTGLAEFIAEEELDRHQGFWWSPDGQRILALEVEEKGVPVKMRAQIYADRTAMTEQRYPAAGEANAKVGALWIDLASGKSRPLPLPPQAEYVARAGWFADGMPWIQWLTRDQKRLGLVEFALPGGKPRTILTEEDEAWVELSEDLRELPNHPLSGKPALVWSSERSGRKQLYWLDRSSGALKPMTDQSEPVARVVCAKGDRLIFAGATLRGRGRELFEFDLADERAADSAASRTRILGEADASLPGAERRWRDASADRGCQRLLLSESRWGVPPSVQVVSLPAKGDGQSLQSIALGAERPDPLLADIVPQVQVLEMVAADGKTPLNVFYLPPLAGETGPRPGGKHPVIVRAYGGPTTAIVRFAWDGETPLMAYWQRLGFGVMMVDTRGMSFRDRAITRMHAMAIGRVEVQDLFAAVRQLPQKVPGVDEARIGFTGWSYGGYLAARSMLDVESPFAAAVAGAPPTDWTLYDTAYTERYLGLPEGGKASAYAESNLIPRAKWLEKPLMLIHGTADDNVLFENSLRLISALQNEGKLFETVIYPGHAHGIAGRKSRLHLARTQTDFFKRHLMIVPRQP